MRGARWRHARVRRRPRLLGSRDGEGAGRQAEDGPSIAEEAASVAEGRSGQARVPEGGDPRRNAKEEGQCPPCAAAAARGAASRARHAAAEARAAFATAAAAPAAVRGRAPRSAEAVVQRGLSRRSLLAPDESRASRRGGRQREGRRGGAQGLRASSRRRERADDCVRASPQHDAASQGQRVGRSVSPPRSEDANGDEPGPRVRAQEFPPSRRSGLGSALSQPGWSACPRGPTGRGRRFSGGRGARLRPAQARCGLAEKQARRPLLRRRRGHPKAPDD